MGSVPENSLFERVVGPPEGFQLVGRQFHLAWLRYDRMLFPPVESSMADSLEIQGNSEPHELVGGHTVAAGELINFAHEIGRQHFKHGPDPAEMVNAVLMGGAAGVQRAMFDRC